MSSLVDWNVSFWVAEPLGPEPHADCPALDDQLETAFSFYRPDKKNLSLWEHPLSSGQRWIYHPELTLERVSKQLHMSDFTSRRYPLANCYRQTTTFLP